MATLGSLPSELLVEVFLASDTLHAAAQLSTVDRRLQSAWADNLDTIAFGVLRRQIDAFDEAINLATIETSPGSRSQSQGATEQLLVVTDNPRSSIRILLPKLQYNAQLASDVCASFSRFIAAGPATELQRTLPLVSLPYVYYILRQIVIAFKGLQLRPALGVKLEGLSEDVLFAIFGMSLHLINDASMDERVRHGVPKDEKDWLIYDEFVADPCVFDWEFAYEVAQEALNDKQDGRPHTFILKENFHPDRI